MLGRKKRDMGGIPTASMSDISFCLLVFFLATTTFDVKKGLGIVLPPASSDAVPEKKVKLKDDNITKLGIGADGSLSLKVGSADPIENFPIGQLEAKIRSIVTENPNMVISIKTNRQSKYSNMIAALDKVQAAGAEKISLSTN